MINDLKSNYSINEQRPDSSFIGSQLSDKSSSLTGVKQSGD